MMTNKDSLSHAACKRTDTIFSNFTKPTFLSKLRHWLSPPSTSSSNFTRLSVFANTHFVHELRCKTRKPIEQWTVICDTHTCVLFSGNSESSALSSFLSQPPQHTSFPFTKHRSRVTMSVVSTNQNWKCVCILLCQETAIRSCHWGCS